MRYTEFLRGIEPTQLRGQRNLWASRGVDHRRVDGRVGQRKVAGAQGPLPQYDSRTSPSSRVSSRARLSLPLLPALDASSWAFASSVRLGRHCHQMRPLLEFSWCRRTATAVRRRVAKSRLRGDSKNSSCTAVRRERFLHAELASDGEYDVSRSVNCPRGLGRTRIPG